jgi:hypothetical protein
MYFSPRRLFSGAIPTLQVTRAAAIIPIRSGPQSSVFDAAQRLDVGRGT